MKSQYQEHPIDWDELVRMREKIASTTIELNESCGPVRSFLQTSITLHFLLSWLRHWKYSDGPGCWGERTSLDGYELVVHREHIKSMILAPNGDIVIICEHGGEITYQDRIQIRTGNPVGASICAEL